MGGLIKRTDPLKRDFFATPDKTKCMFKKGDFISVTWMQRDAIPFAIFGGDVYIGNYEESHYDVFGRYDLFSKAGTVTVQGRIWTDKKIVATWENFTSGQAKIVIEAFKQQANLNINNYYFLSDVDFEGKGKGIVYGIPMGSFASMGIKATDLPRMYERQGNLPSGREKPEDAQFSYNGVSGRLGRYLTTTWGDSVERDDLCVIVSEAVNKILGNIYEERNGNNMKISAKGIEKDVMNCMWDLKERGEMEVVFGPNINDYFTASFADENNIMVEYLYKQTTVPCPIGSDEKHIAKCIMKGFAELYLNRTGEKQAPTNVAECGRTVKLTEFQLRGIVRECVSSYLNENEDLNGMMNAIDAEIKKVGDAHVSRFYSDENYITVAVHQDCGSWARNEVTKTMRKYGYDCYDMGGNGNYVMITYRKL